MPSILCSQFGIRRILVFALMMAAACSSTGGLALGQTGGQDSPGTAPRGAASVESLFIDFLHYARLGRFTAADAYAKALLAHADLDPVELLAVADRDQEAVRTVLILIKNSTISESAARVLEVLHQGENLRRQSTDRIQRNIELLGGDPQQEFFGRKYLAESGEYAVPHLVQTLFNGDKSDLWPRVISAIPAIGKPAVNPLVVALFTTHDDIRLNLIRALGEIGYPQAIPYLRRLLADDDMPKQTQEAATRAIERIETVTGRSYPGSAADRFFALGDQYYNEDDSVRADPRLDEANVWYWDESIPGLKRTPVPTAIFGQIMAMRCCEEALRIKNDHAGAIALWLSANIRRESRLGLNVESGDASQTTDADKTRPNVFPRALYFTQSAGPLYAHMVLDRAVRDNDSAVALGAIEALRITAGESSLVGTEDHKQPLARALQFSDLVVRLRAALALGAALPKSPFDGSQLVVPLLATALGQTGREQVLVADADEANLNRVVGIMRNGDRDAIGHASVFEVIARARSEFQSISGLLLSTDVTDPTIQEALVRVRGELIYSKLPVVILAKAQQSVMAEQLAGNDPYIEMVDAAADATAIEDAYRRIRERTGQTPLGANLALSMAIQAGETLRRIVVDGQTVYDAGAAEPALIAALSSLEDELRTLAASVLALLRTDTAQRAIAHVALDDTNTESLRVAAFASLAESAKNNGNRLEPAQIAPLIEIAHRDADLTIRTAASQALGAINLTTNEASKIIRSFYGG